MGTAEVRATITLSPLRSVRLAGRGGVGLTMGPGAGGVCGRLAGGGRLCATSGATAATVAEGCPGEGTSPPGGRADSGW